MVRLHMLHHQVIRLTPLNHCFHIGNPLLSESLVHRIHHRDLLIQDHIGIIRHSVGYLILPLK